MHATAKGSKLHIGQQPHTLVLEAEVPVLASLNLCNLTRNLTRGLHQFQSDRICVCGMGDETIVYTGFAPEIKKK